MRLIDADKLKETFEKTVVISPMPYAFVKQTIDNATTIELLMARGTNGVVIPTTRPQGKWITDNLHNIICNKCGGIRRDNRNEYISFCNRCGTRMMKGEEE